MKPEAQKELDRLLRRQRLKSLLPAAAIAVLVVAVLGYIYWPDTQVSQRVVLGTVNNWTRPQTALGNGNAAITVLLEDGRTVLATSAGGDAPEIGQSITLVQQEYASGRVTYTWYK